MAFVSRARVASRPHVAAALALCLLTFVSAAEAGWVWTPETGWMRKKYIPKATAREQYDHAVQLHKEGEFERAAVAFYMVQRFYPDSVFIEEADFMRAECLFRMGRNVTAFDQFERFLERHPDSKKRAAAIETEMKIGEKLLGGAKKDWIGSVKIFRDREKGVEIIERAIRHDPYHKRVPDALMLIGDARLKSRWYSEAKRVYARIAEEHPKSTLRPRAEYKAVLAESKAVEDVAYDTSSCEAIERKCKRLKAKNKGEMAKKAENLEDAIRNRRARKDFEIAEFYRKAGRRVAALTYYKLVAKNFKGTESAKRASECVAKLSGE